MRPRPRQGARVPGPYTNLRPLGHGLEDAAPSAPIRGAIVPRPPSGGRRSVGADPRGRSSLGLRLEGAAPSAPVPRPSHGRRDARSTRDTVHAEDLRGPVSAGASSIRPTASPGPRMSPVACGPAGGLSGNSVYPPYPPVRPLAMLRSPRRRAAGRQPRCCARRSALTLLGARTSEAIPARRLGGLALAGRHPEGATAAPSLHPDRTR